MKKKIAILGSTGSIGSIALNILKKDKKNFEINLLSTNKNINKILKQAKEFNVKNVIIADLKSYNKAKHKFQKLNINIFNNFNNFNKILKSKNDFILISLTGLDGLLPTIKSIKHTKNILIANKEALICGWNLIYDELKKNKTKFIPVDSEHFSIFSLLQNHNVSEIEKIYITASGGPFLKLPKKKFSEITIQKTLNHPNWRMGKKISVDSATLMNKVFEVIEAKNIFNLDYNKISILIHPNSYLHAIVKFKTGLIKLLLHDPNMKIPIYNAIYCINAKPMKTQPLKLNILNNLNLKEVDIKKFPSVKILKKLSKNLSLYETVLITINDYLVEKFLTKKITYLKLISMIEKILNFRQFEKYKSIKPENIDQIYHLRKYLSLKLDNLHI